MVHCFFFQNGEILKKLRCNFINSETIQLTELNSFDNNDIIKTINVNYIHEGNKLLIDDNQGHVITYEKNKN